MPAIPFLIFGAIAAALAAARSSRQRSNLAWAKAARELGITLEPTRGGFGFFGKMSMSGHVHDMELTIDTRQSDDTTYTRYRVTYPPLGLSFQAKRQHALTRLGKVFGYQDIEIGDPLFDDQIIVKGDYPERIADFLTPARRVAITGFIELYPGAVITNTGISYEKRGLDSEEDRLISTMQRMLSVARQLRGADRVTERAAERRLAGDVGEALDILEEAGDTGDPFVDFLRKQQVGEIRYARREPKQAIEVFRELKKQAPADPEVDRWAKYRPTKTSEPPEPAVTATHSGDAEAVAAHLFHEDNYSFDTMEIFEREYEGSRVEWAGILKRLRRFDHDRDFGDGPGVKAVFAIATLASDLYAGREVDAIVRLPRGAEDTLEIGERYGFSGRLSRCDPAMRNLFISDAALS
jgi:hypothetical protein